MADKNNGARSIMRISKLIKGTLGAALFLAAICLVLLIASCVRPDAEIFQRFFKLSGIACLVACALLAILVFARSEALPQPQYVDSAIPLNCPTAYSFREGFVSSIEEKGFQLIRKIQLESGALFLCFFRGGSITQYVVLSLSMDFGRSLMAFSRDYINKLLPSGCSGERTFLHHIICTDRYSPNLKKFCERNTVAPAMDQFKFTAAVSLEDAALYISRPKDCPGCWTLKDLEKQLIFFVQPLISQSPPQS